MKDSTVETYTLTSFLFSSGEVLRAEIAGDMDLGDMMRLKSEGKSTYYRARRGGVFIDFKNVDAIEIIVDDEK